MSDEIKDLIAVNRAVIDQADAWLADLRRVQALTASIRARSLGVPSLTRRRRITRILHRFAAWLLADSLAAWATITQDDVDAGVDAWGRSNP